ncbi:MAG: orotidine-5'-phosphate decarboxylase [Patescibacteria group bacterium]|nr:orotidine-5'-phosphate decarboxylase [Patescibacteria group bacterium]
MGFRERLEQAWALQNSLVCVGLDTDLQQLPACVRDRNQWDHDRLHEFNQTIVDSCAPFCSVFKLNLAFYFGLYSDSTLGVLVGTIKYIRKRHPRHVIILDAKWGDVKNTAARYAGFAFQYLGVDAVTLWPGTGSESMRPFFDDPEHGAIFVCRTSNPGSPELQDAPVFIGYNDGTRAAKTEPYWFWQGKQIARWNQHGNVGLVMGATFPGELRQMREAVGDDMFSLNPGIGAQTKEQGIENPIQAAVEAGQNSSGKGMIINSSRGIIFASSGEDYAEAAARETERLRDEINRFRIRQEVTR